jgi:hypothetical protein
MATHLQDDASLNEQIRRTALNLLLRRSGRLQEHVHSLFERLVFVRDVVAALEVDDSLPPRLRRLAVERARARGDDLHRLNACSWDLVLSAGGDLKAYATGLRGAEIIAAAQPDNVEFLKTLGLAQFRNGWYEDARATLTRCVRLRRQQGSAAELSRRAVLVMTLVELGQVEEARGEFDLLEEEMRGWSSGDAYALFHEARQLLEGSDTRVELPDDTEHGEQSMSTE